MAVSGPFAEQLKRLISTLNLRKKDFAQSVGIKPGYVSELLAGQRPSETLLIAISCVYGVSRSWLEKGEGSMLAAGQTPRSAPLHGESALDSSLLQLVIEAIEEGLREAKREMLPAKKAELIAAVYDLYAGSGRPIERERILRLITSAA